MARTNGSDSAGEVFALIREGRARTRAALARETGMSRTTLSQRLDMLLGSGLVREEGEAPSSGGRPPMLLSLNRGAGVVLVADLGATHYRLAVADLAGEALTESAGDLDIADGPDVVLPTIVQGWTTLLDEVDRGPDDVRGIGMGLPGPVEYSAGRAVSPPIMPGWDGVAVPLCLQESFPVPVLVDNDVNIMALGEYWTVWRERVADMLFVKVGTGIGSGIVIGGDIYRGRVGAAGDMGHIRVVSAAHQLCRCGNRGCLEAVVGGAALAQQLTVAGTPAADAREVAERARSGDLAAVQLVRTAGRQIGEVLAGAVNLLNPGAIVLGGDVAVAADQLVAGVREAIYERSTVLATKDLRVERSQLGDRAGVTGASVMIIESLLSPSAVDAALRAPAG